MFIVTKLRNNINIPDLCPGGETWRSSAWFPRYWAGSSCRRGSPGCLRPDSLRDGDGDLRHHLGPHLDRGIMKVSLHNVRILPRKSMEVSKFMDLNNFQVFFAARFHRRQ